MHHHGKFGGRSVKLLPRYGDSHVVKIGPVRHVRFLKMKKFLQSTGYTRSKCVITPNLVKIDRTVAEIRADNGSLGHWVMGHGSWVKRVNEYG